MSGIVMLLGGDMIYFFLAVAFGLGLVLEIIAAYCYWKTVKESRCREEESRSVRRKGDSIEKKSTVIYSNRYKEDIIRECERPNKCYAMAEQLIPLLPLLGILGTVIGLSSGLSSIDFENLFNSGEEGMKLLFGRLGYALETTISGILAAVVLKAVGVLLIVSKVEKINSKLDILDAQIAQIDTALD